MSKKKSHPKGMGGIYERGGMWCIRFTWQGRDHRESSGSPRKGDAVDLLKDRIKEMRDGTFQPGAARVKLSDLRDMIVADCERNGRKYVTRVKQCFANLERIIGPDARARDIDASRLDTYVQKRLVETVGPSEDEEGNPVEAKKTSAGTINRELACLKRAWKLAIQKRRLAVMPHIEMLREDNIRTRFPSPDEIEGVIAELPERLRDPVRFIATTGWRAREAFNLAWRHVDDAGGVIRLEAHETKTGKVRALPYAQDPRLAALIAERKAATATWQREHGQIVEHVFWHPGTDAKGQPTALPNRAYARAWEKACERAKVADLHLHDLRRAYARAAIRAGVDERTIMRLAGWATRSTFDRYSVRNDDDLADGVRKLAKAARERHTAPRTREA